MALPTCPECQNEYAEHAGQPCAGCESEFCAQCAAGFDACQLCGRAFCDACAADFFPFPSATMICRDCYPAYSEDPDFLFD